MSKEISKDLKKTITALAKNPELRKKVEGASSQKEKQQILEKAGLTVSYSRKEVKGLSTQAARELGKGGRANFNKFEGPGPLQSTVEWVGVVVAAAAAAAAA